MRQLIRFFQLCLILFVLSLNAVQSQDDSKNGCVVTAPPSKLKLDPFYSKYCDVDGISILSSVDIPDEALEQAWDIASHLLQVQGYPNITEILVENQVKIGIIGANEVISDLPDYSMLYTLYPDTDWDTRTRGVGATTTLPMTSGAEENLLCYAQDAYQGEEIFVHEFSHTVKIMGLQYIDPTFETTVLQAYDDAIAKNLWVDTYAATNAEEYWAEGVQSYFNVNFEADPANGIHNFVNTRAELETYDPGLFGLIDALYRDLDWQPTCLPSQDTTLVAVCAPKADAAPIEIIFENQTQGAINLYWVAFDCKETQYVTLQPGESFTQSTFAGHVWVIRSLTGNLLGRYAAQKDQQSITIPTILCSPTGDAPPVDIIFENQTQKAVNLYWVGFDCKETLYATLQPGESFPQSTFAGHVWVIRKLSGDLLEQYYGEQTQSPVIIN